MVRGLIAAAAGTILGLAGQDALAARCRAPGDRCHAAAGRGARAGNGCCTGQCDPETLRCPCPEGQHYCPHARTCAACCDDADCGEGETCHNGICQRLLGDLECGDHEVTCAYVNGGQFADAGVLGKHGYHVNVTVNACRPSVGCPTLNADCNDKFPDLCRGGCIAYPTLCGDVFPECSSCFYSENDLKEFPGRCYAVSFCSG
jgi:hypothetical protein